MNRPPVQVRLPAPKPPQIRFNVLRGFAFYLQTVKTDFIRFGILLRQSRQNGGKKTVLTRQPKK